jgi:hypothetical protein
MRRQVVESLKHKYPEQRITFEFRHDVFDFLFNGLGRKQNQWLWLGEEDLYRYKFPGNWGCLYNNDGDGVRIKYDHILNEKDIVLLKSLGLPKIIL